MPKGGGAIQGIGEKFAANPTSGAGSMTIPIATSPGRGGFGPQLTLSYNSGSGNGPFGFGWSLSLPSITRKTEQGLPRYDDAGESDVFILSGAEDLVPEFQKDAAGKWVFEDGRHVVHDKPRVVHGVSYNVRRYRPRIDSLFARIERWTLAGGSDVHWRSISKDNILTIYGKDSNSRISDPDNPAHVFAWLICETRDDKGNAVLYRYRAEDGAGVGLGRVCERNRGDREDKRRTANRYLKTVRYGNRRPLLNADGRRPVNLSDLPAAQVGGTEWMFELVLDYGEHDLEQPTPDDAGPWTYRGDPFSTYRSGFEVRTTRLCRRALMFHHVPDVAEQPGYDGLVRSTDFVYSQEVEPADPRRAAYSFLRRVTQTGYRRVSGGYERQSLPPVEFGYTEPVVQELVQYVDAASLENLPIGVDSSTYQWTDLRGEGIPGVLSEQAGAWLYKRNMSPIGQRPVELAPAALVNLRPNADLAHGRASLLDLAGDGQPDLVLLEDPAPGFYESDGDLGWLSFRPFEARLKRSTRDPNLRFVDLDGDGHADILITEDDALVWHPSLGETGFGEGQRIANAHDEEEGPRLVFADVEQSIYLADMSGDGLSDFVRIRNGEVCYWPNLGYGRFGRKIAMDRSPTFDHPDQFDQKRIRLTDIDGSGASDIIYLHRDGVRLYFNQSGNSWAEPQTLGVFPPSDDLVSVAAADLLGNGTACLVWSSSRPADARKPMRYVNLMGGAKPHLLVKIENNLGAETTIRYAPSTKFYLQDERDRNPWLTKLPFPVHVVERVETYDRISRNRFVTRYVYHHGHFDGQEREFRGFGMVEQSDTEEIGALTTHGRLPAAANESPASHVPAVLTKTWFHTGLYLGRDHVSDFFAGLLDERDTGEYYRPPGLPDNEARALLLADSELPPGLTTDEEREACRALKGSMLRQEVYALDRSPRAGHPYIVSEQNFSPRREQPRAGNRHTVLSVQPRETITYHYERDPDHPRVKHALTLEVDRFGNVLKEAAVGYGRNADSALPLDVDREKQGMHLVTYTERRFTNPIDDAADSFAAYRPPLPCEVLTYELTGYAPSGGAGRFRSSDFVDDAADGALSLGFDSGIDYEDVPTGDRQRRPIEHVRTLYRADDLTSLLPLGEIETRAIAGQGYKLIFTAGLLKRAFERNGQPLLANAEDVLGGAGADRGGYLSSQDLTAAGLFPASDPVGSWWIPSGRMFLSPTTGDTPAEELAYAREHFLLPHRFRDPFHSDLSPTESRVRYDDHDLLTVETADALGNRITADNDYRVLQPWRVMDANRNRAQVALDSLGMVVGTAVSGKPEENFGDSLDGFVADLPESALLAHLADPLAAPEDILGRATTRLIYDLFAYQRSKAEDDPQPAVVYTLARETHDADLQPGETTRVQHGFTYSDGFGREIQKKLPAEPGPIVEGGPLIARRWVGSGWVVFNNKGKPVRQYEPFFTATHRFEFGVEAGVSPILFYDPVGRAIATLHPNNTYEKLAFDPWRLVTWDLNDTVLGDPRTDDDIKGYVSGYFSGLPAIPLAPPWVTWRKRRKDGALGAEEQAAARKATEHANTPTIAYFDTLGRPFLTLADNGPDPDHPGENLLFATRVELDIEGNQRSVRDAIEQTGDEQGRIVMRYRYDMLGNRIHQFSMEAGERWMLNDALGKPIRIWNSRGHAFRTEYDPLRRPIRHFVAATNPADPDFELLTERLVYGEQHPEAEARNLRDRVYLHLDQAGSLLTEACDFKGNVLGVSRRLTGGTQYREAVDWGAVDAAAVPSNPNTPIDLLAFEAAITPRLEPDGYTSLSRYDALNRPTSLSTPRTPQMQPSVIRPGYNEANLLERVDVNLRGANAGGAPVWTPFVRGIDYDAKGQRQRIDYGNGVSTFYDYDPETFRLVGLVTQREAAAFPGDCPRPPPTDWPGCQVQNLRYTYDPVGNITHIRDDAQQRLYFNNTRVDPSNEYNYDALYRLIEATGRELLGQGGLPVPHTHDDALRMRLPHPGDGNALARYTERYVYDAVGNFLQMQHRGNGAAAPNWTRSYSYAEPSLLENGTAGFPLKTSNRLSSTTVGGNAPLVEPYYHDAHGNMTRMPHLGGVHPAPNMHWDFADQLQRTDHGGGGTAYYVYDSAGQRVRKVWEKSAALVEERIYLGNIEIFKRRQGAERLERESLHIVDDRKRIALVETRTADSAGDDPSPAQLTRYQFGNHLGSASLELDDSGQIISYEEYTPYGSTAYHSVRSQTETPKRYRYTGKERDEESGLYYHGARYYAPWLARWTSVDPSGLVDGPNLYAFLGGQPITMRDSTGRQGERPKEIIVPGKFTGKESVEELHAFARAHGYDFEGTPKWVAGRKSWNVGVLHHIDKTGTASEADAKSGAQRDEGKASVAGQGVVTTYNAAQRAKYESTIKTASKNSVERINELRASKKPGAAVEAWEEAKKASATREAARDLAREKLTPSGAALSKEIDQTRSFEHYADKYSSPPEMRSSIGKGNPPIEPSPQTADAFQVAEDVAKGAGKSRGGFSGFALRAGKWLGPIGIGVGAGLAAKEIADAPEGQRGRVASREGAAFVGGFVGAELGAAAGVALAGGVSGFLVGLGVVAGPVGWLAIGLAIVGGIAGAWAFGKLFGNAGEGAYELAH